MHTSLRTRAFICFLALSFVGIAVPQTVSADGINPEIELQPLRSREERKNDRAGGNKKRGEDRADRGRHRDPDRDRTRPPRPPRRDDDGRRTRPRPPRRDDDFRRRPPRPIPPRRPVPPPRRWDDDDDDWRRYPPRRPYPPPRPIPPRPVPPRPYPPTTPPDGYSSCSWNHGQISCSVMSFRWSRPHQAYTLRWRQTVSTNHAQYVGLQSVFNRGRVGRTGTAGISAIWATYITGERQNLLPILQRLYPHKVSNDGRVYFTHGGDKMRVPLRPHQYLSTIQITADSWIDQYTSAFIALTLER